MSKTERLWEAGLLNDEHRPPLCAPEHERVRRCPTCTVELHWTMNRGTGPVRRHEREWCSGRCADAGGRV